MNRLILQPLLCVKCKGTRKQKDALYAAMGMSSMIESMCFNKASAIYKSGFIDIIDLFQNGSAGTDLMRDGGSIYE